MSDTVIQVENLSKQYRIGRAAKHYDTLRDQITETLSALYRRNGKHCSEENTIWALKDVSFEVKQGEVLGIIGPNGAGKSTLLKILSRITEPTTGLTQVIGRIASLLEVGTGFHPELTGRENTYLNGAILGMTKREVDRKFDEIVTFAEIETFIDTPVKHYSSGMYVRLAFAVAAHLEPEILIVDEVLAVGDLSFQSKCLRRMGEVGNVGRTVIFVSHNLQAISRLAKRTILLEAGGISVDDSTEKGIKRYREISSQMRNHKGEYINCDVVIGLSKATVVTSEPGNIHRFGRALVFEFELNTNEALQIGNFAFQVIDEYNMGPIINPWFVDENKRWIHKNKVLLKCVIPKPRLYQGRYSITTHLGDRGTGIHYETVEQVCEFEVVMDGTQREYDWSPGTCVYIENVQWAAR